MDMDVIPNNTDRLRGLGRRGRSHVFTKEYRKPTLSLCVFLPYYIPPAVRSGVKQTLSQQKTYIHPHTMADRKEACRERLPSLSGFNPGFVC